MDKKTKRIIKWSCILSLAMLVIVTGQLMPIISFIALFLVIVTFHELGHYLAGRMCNIHAKTFSIGFGKAIYSRKSKNGTKWCLAMIPLGGYVEFEPNEKEIDPPPKNTLESLKESQRFFIYSAGPLASFLLSLIIMIGININSNEGLSPIIDFVPKNSIAYQEGLRAGDVISHINNERVDFLNHVYLSSQKVIFAKKDLEIVSNSNVYKLPHQNFLDDEKDQIKVKLSKLGIYFDESYITNEISKISKNSLAYKHGLKEKDKILSINNHPWVRPVDSLQLIGKEEGVLSIMVERDQDTKLIDVPFVANKHGELENKKLGIELKVDRELLKSQIIKVDKPLFKTIIDSTVQTWEYSKLIISKIYEIIFGNESFVENVAGPVGIVEMTGTAASYGFKSWLLFMMLFSINLGIMNLLPIPALDGGQMVISLYQIIIRRQISKKIKLILIGSSWVFLLGLTFFVLIIDIMKKV